MHKSKNIALLIIIACQLMIVLDASIMITALPEIGRTLHLATTTLTWVQNAYILAFGGLLLLGARAGDIFGRKQVFMVGIGLFTAASLLVGLANSTEFLFMSRALQGIAAALATPSALSLLSVTFVEPKERSKAIALYSAVSGVGGSVGLLLGGVLTDLISWRLGMFINVPIGLLLLSLAPKYLPKTERVSGHFDFMGAVTSVIGMTALVFGFIRAADKGWVNPETVLSLVVGLVLIISFIVIEKRAKQPITPLRLFNSRERTAGYLGRFFFVGGMFSMMYFLSQFLQTVFGFNAFEASLAFVPMTAVQFAMMYAVPKLLSKYGTSKLLVAGILVALAGMSWLSGISVETNFYIGIVMPMILLGVGAGIIFIPFTSLGLSNVEARDAGAASGLVNVAHQIGGSVGLAVLASIFGGKAPAGSLSKQAFAHAVSLTITGSTLFFAASLTVVVLLLLVKKEKQAPLKVPA
ncbi:MFS transporter [Paenibacillus sp. VMFN-D1]|uniref:MFS transporter n=1 Tax=Paenibacillus sp. VMFN-D1 TaxID=2135608 RepID=UPI000E27E6C5|nr:MFS transporter [Paenibacillus sp. VMFN-D1]RED37392.1 EmrB/QacA subfamily drug resistance transporter [Paenibacillus sp. VMFN-D1]